MESSEDLDWTEVEYKETNSYYDLLKDVDKSDEIKEIWNYEKQYNEWDDKDGAQEISDLTGIALGVMMLEEIKKGMVI